MSLKTRILLALTVVSVVVIGTMQIANNKSKEEIETRFRHATAAGKGSLWSKILTSQYDRMELGASALVRDKETRDAILSGDLATVSENVATTYNLLSSSGVITGLEVVDIDAKTMFAFPSKIATGTLSSSALVKQTFKTGNVSNGIEESPEGILMVTVSFPLFKRGKVIGVGIYRLSLQSAIEDFKANDESEVLVYSKNNKRLYSTDDAFWNAISSELPQLGEEGFSVLSHNETIQSITSFPIQSNDGIAIGSLVTSNDFTESYAAQKSSERNSLLLTALAVVLGVGGILWFISRSLKPIGTMATAAQAIAKGNLEQKILYESTDEVGTLAASFRHMIVELDAQRTLVEERSLALNERNDNMQALLDTVDQGFLTLHLDGTMGMERSAVVDSWFHSYTETTSLADYLEPYDAKFSAFFAIGWEEVVDGFLPRELSMDQLPNTLQVEGKTYSVRYSPIGDLEEMEGCLVVISDITEQLAHEVAEREQRELNELVERMLRDRKGFRDFYDDAQSIIDALKSEQYANDVPVLKRILHTLKGNSALFGLHSVAQCCHVLEDAIEELPQEETLHLPTEESLALFERWQCTKDALAVFIGNLDSDDISLAKNDYTWLLNWHERHDPKGKAFGLLIRYSLEEARRPLVLLAEQGEVLASRLGKSRSKIIVESNDILLDPVKWRPFFSSLTHVVRNAVDHGLLEDGESEKVGKIILSAERTSQHFIVRVSDNGRGIDWDKVRDKAEELHLPNKTEKDLLNALLSDGVSTKSEVSETSGRGVGMAAVSASVEALGGTIAIESRLGKGTTWLFRFPLEASETQYPFQPSETPPPVLLSESA